MAKERDVSVIDYFYNGYRHGPRQAIRFLRARGKTVQMIRAFCVSQAVLDICYNFDRHENRKRPIRVLRFYGHGGPGRQVVGGDRSAEDPAQVLEVVDGRLRHRSSLALVTPLMNKKKGRVEMHGCYVGDGHTGKELLLQMAGVLQVPVLAAGAPQYNRTWAEALAFEGKVYVAVPGADRLRSMKIKNYGLDD